MRHHWAALLREAGLVKTCDVKPIKRCCGCEYLIQGHQARATNPHRVDTESIDRDLRDLPRRPNNRQLNVADNDCSRRYAVSLDGDEAWAVSIKARIIRIARALMDLGLAAKNTFDGLHRKTRAFNSTVSAALAHRFVDNDSLLSIRYYFALTKTA